MIPAPNGNEAKMVGEPGPDPSRLASPTVSGMVTAGVSLMLLAAASVLLLVPTVFYLVPIPPEAAAVTLCLPGIGPLQRFREGLPRQQEERMYIHEGVHADQCQRFGATWYARRAATPKGRLTLEAQALCAEVAVLSRRGSDLQVLRDRTVEILATEYFEDGSVQRRDIAVAVDGACGVVNSE
jgi:hypothetical protein